MLTREPVGARVTTHFFAAADCLWKGCAQAFPACEQEVEKSLCIR
jgi:hypothetical protein